MRLLDSAERHSSFISEMQSACNGTAWEADVHKWWNGDCVCIRIHHTEETLKQQYTGEGENVYAPDIYFDEDPFGKEGWGFKIQTTSYGALKTSEIEKFAASYHQAVALVHKLSAIINEYYPTDTATK